jgi:hypothetical protein
MSDIYEEHLEMIEEEYFFGESDPYDDDCPHAACVHAVDEVFGSLPGMAFPNSPLRRLAQIEDDIASHERHYRRSFRNPLRFNDTWNSVPIGSMTEAHLRNCIGWITKNIRNNKALWWAFMRMEFELLRRGARTNDRDEIVSALDKHIQRCKSHGWAECELGWFSSELTKIKAAIDAMMLF